MVRPPRLRRHLADRPPADLPRIDVATLMVHGTEDRILPIDSTARRLPELIADCTLHRDRRRTHMHGECVFERFARTGYVVGGLLRVNIGLYWATWVVAGGGERGRTLRGAPDRPEKHPAAAAARDAACDVRSHPSSDSADAQLATHNLRCRCTVDRR